MVYDVICLFCMLCPQCYSLNGAHFIDKQHGGFFSVRYRPAGCDARLSPPRAGVALPSLWGEVPRGRSDGKERTHEREKYEPGECNMPSAPLLPTRADDGIMWGVD